jgi:hypothetical protein
VVDINWIGTFLETQNHSDAWSATLLLVCVCVCVCVYTDIYIQTFLSSAHRNGRVRVAILYSIWNR